MPEELRIRIQQLHEWYCRNVMQVRLTPEVERLWFEWLRAGYSGPDLRDVIRYIRRQISINKRNEGALKLTNLIQRSEGGFIGFDQDLGLARARANLSVDKRLEPVPDAQSAGKSNQKPVISDQTSKAESAPLRAHVDGALKRLKEAVE